MMNRRTVAILAILLLSVLLAVSILLGTANEAALDGEDGFVVMPEETPGDETGQIRPGWPDRWRETMDWPDVDGPFMADAADPRVLHRFARMEDGLFYFADGRLWHEYAAEGEEGGWRRSEVAVFRHLSQIHVWQIGSGWLLGGSDADGEGAAGLWAWLDLSRFGGPPYYLSIVQGASFHAGELAQMTVSDEPALAVAMVGRNGYPEEYVFVPAQSRWQYLFANNWDTHGPHADGGNTAARFHDRNVFDFGNGTLHALEDEWGTLLALEREGETRFWRYAGFKALDFKPLPTVDGETRWLGQWLNAAGNVVYAMPEWHFVIDDALSPELWEEGWIMVRHNGFLRVADGTIENMRYDEIWQDGTSSLQHTAWSVPLGNARYAGREGGHLLFRQDGQLKRIAIHDAHSYRPAEPAAAPEGLWRVEAPYALRPVSGVATRPDFRELRLPSELELYDRFAPDSMPQRLEDVLQRECWTGCGDFEQRIVVRQAGDDWFVLADRTLYALDGDSLEAVAEWPVNTRSTVFYEKGGSTDSARDFAKIGDFWYVADTYGHRVLQLDGEHRVRNEMALPFPTALKEEDGGLAVTSLRGITRLTHDLAVVEEAPMPADSFAGWTEGLLEADRIHTDEESGWTWVASPGWLNRFNGETGQWERRFIGHPFNGYVQPILLPHGGEVWVVMDEHAIRFAADGSWLATYEYPRSGIPFIHDYPYSGEMTWQLDERRGQLYFVRGTGVHALDLATGEHREVYRQEETTIGPLLLADGKLLFTLHAGGPDDPETADNQLAVLEPASGRLIRYGMAPGLMTYGMDERGIIMAKPQMAQEFRLDHFVLEMDFGAGF